MVSIEDPFDQDDWAAWSKFTFKGKATVNANHTDVQQLICAELFHGSFQGSTVKVTEAFIDFRNIRTFGGYAQFHTNFVMKDGAERMYIWEPGLAYDFGARIFKKSHIWNLGLQVTNIRHFLVERSYSPNFIFNGNYRIRGEGDDHLNLMFEAGFQPSGILHIVTNYYSFFFNVGVTCKI